MPMRRDLSSTDDPAIPPPAAAVSRIRSLRTHLRRPQDWQPIHRFLGVLALLFVANQIILVLLFPAFSGHDEVAHFAYLRTFTEGRRMPIIPHVDRWRRASSAERRQMDVIPNELYRYCPYVTQDWWCALDDPRFRVNAPRGVNVPDDAGDYVLFPSGWIYTANHPPLFYIAAAPVYWLSNGASTATQLYALRLVAVPFVLLTVLFAFLTARTLFPNDLFMATVAPTYVAFQPQISYEGAIFNNDATAIAVYAAVLWLLVLGIKRHFPLGICAWLGVAFGLALVAKGTSLTAVPIIALAVVLGVGWRSLRAWLGRGALVAAIGAVIAFPWYLFLYRTYGDLSGLGRIERLQWWNYDDTSPPSILDQLVDPDFAWFRWSESWGEFGWRKIPLSDTFLWVLLVAHIVALLGLVVGGAMDWRARHRRHPSDIMLPLERWQVLGCAVLLVTCLVAYGAILEFGTRFELTQARYYFPAINALAVLLTLGLRMLIPPRFHAYAQGAVFAAMVLLNVLIATQYIIPHWQLSAG